MSPVQKAPQPAERDDPSATDCPYSMTEEALKLRQGKPEYGRVWPQVYVGVLACFSSLSFGTTLGWAYTVFSDMYEAPDRIDPAKKWLMSITLLGCSVGITSCNFLMKQMGPKRVIRVVEPFFIVSWWLMLTQETRVQLAGRFFLGFLGITCSTASETLLFHTVHYALRRYLMVFQSCTMNVGILVIRLVGSATTEFWATVVCASLPLVHYGLLQVVPESPVFLYAKSPSAAAKSLAWYRGSGNFYVDMACIKKDWDATRLDSEAYRYMMFSKAVYRGLFIILGLTVFQVFAGYFIFLFYSMPAWAGGTMVFDEVVDATIIGSCFVVTKLFWGCMHVVHPHWKIRKFLIVSCFGASFTLAFIAADLRLKRADVVFGAGLSLLCVCLFFFFYDMGLNQFTRILALEYMPVQVYRKVDSLVQALFWLLAFLKIFVFAVALAAFGNYEMFVVFASLTFGAALFCCFCVVEPRGKSLTQVQLEFGANPIGTRGALFNQIRQAVSVV